MPSMPSTYRQFPAAPAGRALRLSGAVTLSTGLSAGIVLTSSGAASTLGVPAWWTWFLTSLQVAALWAAGTKRRWGWLLGAAVQPPWIVYSMLTDQLGFIVGCAVSAAVQAYSYLRSTARARPTISVRRNRHESELLPCPA